MKIAIIGGGACGCFAAANIPNVAGQTVTVFEKGSKLMQKVKVSGGGRCNLTHACHDIPELLKKYPRGQRFLRKTLHEFTPQHTIRWFAQRGVTLKTEEDGRIFPVSDSSQTIIDCLQEQMHKNGAEVRYNKSVVSIKKDETVFNILFADGTQYQADRVLVACGGFAKDEQYKWIESLGHTIEAPAPSLFTFNMPGNPLTRLMGLSVPDTIVKIAGTKIIERGPLLVTHWGMSGPVILRCSAWGARELKKKGYHFRILVNWVPSFDTETIRLEMSRLRAASGSQLVSGKNPFQLPRRFWEYMMEACGIDETKRWGICLLRCKTN